MICLGESSGTGPGLTGEWLRTDRLHRDLRLVGNPVPQVLLADGQGPAHLRPLAELPISHQAALVACEQIKRRPA